MCPMTQPDLRPEEEHRGPIWKHPYFLYVLLSIALFFGLLVAAWLAISNGWLPSR